MIAASSMTQRERGILFSTPMVLALRAGRKTVTRRICRVQPAPWKAHSAEGGCQQADWSPTQCDDSTWDLISTHAAGGAPGFGRCPYGTRGDRLVVQEGHALTIEDGTTRHGRVRVRYLADGTCRDVDVSHAVIDGLSGQVTVQKGRGRPGRFMPRWASRITLEVTDVRVERLHEITDEDARAEGVAKFFDTLPSIGRTQTLTTGECAADAEYRSGFALLWDEINGDRALWKANPWVWRVGFRVLPQIGASA